MLCAESLRVQAYFDGELDALSATDIERHRETCAACRALLQDLEQVRTALRQDLTYESAPPALRTRVLRALDQEVATPIPRLSVERLRNWRPRPFWQGALSGMGGTALAAGMAFFLLAPALTNPILDDLVSAHVRSLMPDHLIDVVSTDKHTVKPWFAGHADVSPVVADFDRQGYRLIGGRADYFEHQRAAVVVYQHGSHVINVFSWAADQRGLPKNTTRNGYHLMFWKMGNLGYCAVSDTAWGELNGLVRLLQDISTGDAG
ncbi:MAG: anti-sigma factor [Pseudomonadota bacterium]|nr:anti-sigma factor [Pseudomonadota bacterium]